MRQWHAETMIILLSSHMLVIYKTSSKDYILLKLTRYVTDDDALLDIAYAGHIVL